MERSAVYRRALAPIMLFAGLPGWLRAAAGFLSRYQFRPWLLRTLAWARRWWLLPALFLSPGGKRSKITNLSGRRRRGGWGRPCCHLCWPDLSGTGFRWSSAMELSWRFHLIWFCVLWLRASRGRIFHAARHEVFWLDFHLVVACGLISTLQAAYSSSIAVNLMHTG